MANINKEMCECMGFYDPSGSCTPYDPAIHPEEPCPSNFWSNVGSWNWGAISDTALQWGYAFGFLQPPSQNLETQMYMMELERQRRQTTMLMVGLGVLMLIVILIVLRRPARK